MEGSEASSDERQLKKPRGITAEDLHYALQFLVTENVTESTVSQVSNKAQKTIALARAFKPFFFNQTLSGKVLYVYTGGLF
jgi:hypothetical protein